MKESVTKAIVLKSIPFKDFDRVVHLFTEEMGLVSAYLRQASKPNHPLHELIAPFSLISILYTQGRGEMIRIIEGKAIDMQVKIRERLSALKGALKCTDCILKTQLPFKVNSRAFVILNHYLAKMSQAPHPEALSASFLLKVIGLEGLFNFANACDRCHQEISKSTLYLSHKESFCSSCKEKHMLELSYDERLQLSFLARVRSWDALYAFPMLEDLFEKVDRIFEEVALEKELARGGT